MTVKARNPHARPRPAVLLLIASFLGLAGPMTGESALPAPGAKPGVGALGRIQPKHGVRRINGPSEFVNVVAELLVDEGDQVRSRQIIARLDDVPSREAQVARLEASLASAEARLSRLIATASKARRDTERAEKLFADGLLPPAQRDEARVALDVAEADIESARAECKVFRASLKEAQAQLERRIIRSPVDGQVLKIHTRAGEKVGEQGIMEIGQTGEMYVFAEVYETDVPHIRVGQRATATSLVLGKPLQGKVERIGITVARKGIFDDDPAASKDARVVDVEIRLDDSAAAAPFTNLQVEVRFEP